MKFPATFFAAPLKALALGLALAASASAYVGQWHSYTDQSRVTSLIRHGAHVYAGTFGGIRRVDIASLQETRFDNLHGLTDVWITGFAVDGDGTLWAVSRDGYLYTPRGNRWETWGRSFASMQWKMTPRAVLAAGAHLYLGSDKGLAVFDAKAKVSQLNITRFRDELGLAVLSLLRRDDTLYVGTTAGIFKARVDFETPLDPRPGYANLADPSVWAHVPADSGRRYDHMVFIGDSLATFGPGTLLQSPVPVEAFDGSPLVVGSRTFPADWNDYQTAVQAEGRVFVGGKAGLVVISDPSGAATNVSYRPPAYAYPRDTLYALAVRDGKLRGQTVSGLYRIDGFSFEPVPSLVAAPSPELLYRYLRNVTVGPNGEAYVGSWGKGLVRALSSADRNWNRTTDSCLAVDDPEDPWTVVAALTPPGSRELFFATYTILPGNTHQIARLDLLTDEITCPVGGNPAPGGTARAMQVFGDTLLGVAHTEGVNFYRIFRGISDVELVSKGHWTLAGSANVAWDLASDAWGRIWTLIGPNLAYLDSLDNSTSRRFTPIDNFVGQDCKNLEEDPAGKLWVGCANGLFHIATGPSGEIASVRRYGLDDGLLGQMIHDIAIDSASGRVWVATDRGLSMFESPSQPALPNDRLPAIIPYPNPFRPHHRVVIFENLPRNATLRLQDPEGRVVRVFHPRDLTGNQVQWDGRNDQGKPVAPGVYLFSVTSGSAVARGKVIVAR